MLKLIGRRFSLSEADSLVSVIENRVEFADEHVTKMNI